MENKTIEELKKIAKDRVFYNPEKRLSSLNELEKREPLDKEFKDMKDSLESSFETYENNYTYNLYSKTTKNMTEDENDPFLYTKKAIYGFSVFFSVLVGAILLAMNFNQLKKKKISFIVVVIGILATFLVGYIGSIFEQSYIIGIINGSLGIVLAEIFWEKFIGSDLRYRKRKIIIPLIICLILTTSILFLMIKSMN